MPFPIQVTLCIGLTIYVLSWCLKWVRFVNACKRRDETRSKIHHMPETGFVRAEDIDIDIPKINEN